MNLFINECEILKQLNHPNIIKMYGYTASFNNRLSIIMEYCTEGELEFFFRQNVLNITNECNAFDESEIKYMFFMML